MRSSLILCALCLVAGCATAPTHAAHPVSSSFYLPPEKAMGGEWCFDPDSPRLRQLLAAPTTTPAEPVDAGALADDVRTLHELMRTQYAGYPELAQAQGFDVDGFFARWEQRLRDHGGTVSFDEGVLQPVRRLRAVVPDNHHAPWGYGNLLRNEPATEVREFQAVLPANLPLHLSDCRVEGGQPFPDTLRIAPLLSASGQAQVVTVSVRGATRSVTLRCGGVSYALSARPLADKPDESHEPAYSWRAIGDTAVIRIRRLGGSTEDLRTLDQLVRDYPQHAQFPRIVFDLRNNDGGNDGYVYDWISQAKRGLWFSGADTTVDGALAPCSSWNPLVLMQILDGTVDSAGARQMREKVKQAWTPNRHRTRYLFRSGLVDDHAAHPYPGRIYVIVDRNSASSGESSAWVLRSALGAQLVGERTAGLFEYGDVRPFVLPRTGVRYSFSTKRNWYETPMESVGVAVDAYLRDVSATEEQIVALLPER